MTQQLVNVGSVAGDGTGDRGQVPFTKVNQNFTELYSSAFYSGVDTGIANAHVVSLSSLVPNPVVFPATAGTVLRFTPAAANTGAATLNGVAIVNGAGAALSGGELQTTTSLVVELYGGVWQILNPNTSALISQLLSQNALGILFYPRTAAEIAAAVIPTNYYINSDWLDPRRYGAIGDGSTDDTVALNSWVAVINASTNPVSTWPSFRMFLCGPLNTISASNFTWNCYSSILVKANSWSSSNHVNLTGSNVTINSLTINGNQGAFSAQPVGQLLNASCNGLRMDSCAFLNSPLVGVQLNAVTQGSFVNCHFDSNCNLGIQFLTCSYLKFTNCTWNYDGYGFQKTLATNAFAAFGFALRFRSHHIEFVNCEALQNGRDGMNTNQGSYAIKYIGCLAWMNGDGGFTLAADNTSSGTPGNSESPFDIEYIDCESYNNWSSGLAAYVPVYNVSVIGGRYYNNNRLVGVQAIASSYFNGLYFAGGSTGIYVDTKAYDDRQLCVVTANASGVLTATNWGLGLLANGSPGTTFVATAQNYPRVALYNASMVFQGYGNITSEASGTVTITTAAFNGVTIASIVAGWYVTQRVQHNGCFMDSGSTGSMAIDGFGQLPGPFGYTGYKQMSSGLASGQNVLLPKALLDYNELLSNPTWDANTGSGTTWSYSLPSGASANYYTTAGATLRSPGCLQLVGGTIAQSSGDGILVTNGLYYGQTCFIECSCWVYANAPGDANITLFWNPGSTFSTTVYHPGGGWKHLKIGAYIPTGNTSIDLRVVSAAGKTNYFDTASIRVKSDYSDNRDYFYPTRNLPS